MDRDDCGYARVSTKDQSLATQDAELHNAGAIKMYREQISAVAARGPQVEVIGPGDVVLVTRLDRLARSIRDLLNLQDR